MGRGHTTLITPMHKLHMGRGDNCVLNQFNSIITDRRPDCPLLQSPRLKQYGVTTNKTRDNEGVYETRVSHKSTTFCWITLGKGSFEAK